MNTRIRTSAMRHKKAPGGKCSGGLGRKRAGDVLLSHALLRSIIAAEALHRRVRNGNGCYRLAMVTSPKMGELYRRGCVVQPDFSSRDRDGMFFLPPAAVFGGRGEEKGGQASRLISTGRLRLLPALHLRPIYPVVSREPSVPAEAGRGDLVFGGAWRLDAFSAYPFAT